MLKQALLVVGTVLGLIETSPAIAFDSFDTIYIDGQPCSSFCQAYMAWSQGVARQSAAQMAPPAQHEIEPSTRHSIRAKREISASSVHALNRNKGVSKARMSRQPAQLIAHQHQQAEPPARADAVQVVKDHPQTEGRPAAQSNTDDPPTAGSNPTADSASQAVSAKQSVVAATGVAEKLTDATAASNEKTAGSPATGAGTETTASIPADADHLVAIVFARPEIKSVSELSGKDVVIDEKRSGLSEKVRTAIVAAGAVEVQLSDSSQSSAIDAVMNGETPAAVLAVLTTEAANAFPEIAGFKIFRIPLSPQ